MSRSRYTYYVIILGGGMGGQGHDYLDYVICARFITYVLMNLYCFSGEKYNSMNNGLLQRFHMRIKN